MEVEFQTDMSSTSHCNYTWLFDHFSKMQTVVHQTDRIEVIAKFRVERDSLTRKAAELFKKKEKVLPDQIPVIDEQLIAIGRDLTEIERHIAYLEAEL
jgi:hypothetical protein